MSSRNVVLELTEFEIEHDYAKHPALAIKKEEDAICKNKIVLLEKAASESEDELDVESVPKSEVPMYNKAKVQHQWLEFEKLVNSRVFGTEKPEPAEPDTEDSFWADFEILKSNMLKNKKAKKVKLIGETVELVKDLYTKFLAIKGHEKEALKRRSAIDKCARAMRRLFTSVGYSHPNLQWLHLKMVEILPHYMLGPYLDVLCSLRSKIPHLMNVSLEPIIQQGDTKAGRALGLTTRKPWDPLTASHMNILRQKLGHSNTPFILCVPNRPPSPKNSPQMRRMRFWNTQLGSFGKIIVQNIANATTPETTFQEYIDQMVKCTRNHVLDLHKRHPNKPIVLVGWDNAALISLFVALLEPTLVTAVCCLGLPLKSLCGWRGDDIDPILGLQCPLFLANGSNARNSSIDEVDDLRDQLNVPSSLVVVQEGDSLLRVSTAIQHEHGMTQSMVDKLVIDEMWEFLNAQITAKYAKVEMPTQIPLGQDSLQPKSVIIDATKPDMPARRGRPPNKSKPDAAKIKEYTVFLKAKIKKLGRMPNHDENKRFYAEFTKQKSRSGKRKADDEEWTINSEKKLKTEKHRKASSSQGLIALPVNLNQKSDNEVQNAALNLERLLEQ